MSQVFHVRRQSPCRPMSYCRLLVFSATPFSNPIEDGEAGHNTRRHNYGHDEEVCALVVHLRGGRGVSTRRVIADAYTHTQLRRAHRTGGTSYTDALVGVLAPEAGESGRTHALVVAERRTVVVARPQIGASRLALRVLVAWGTDADVTLAVFRQLTATIVVAAWRTCPHARLKVYRAHAQGTAHRVGVVPECAWVVEVGSCAGVVPPAAIIVFAVCTWLPWVLLPLNCPERHVSRVV